MMTADCREGIFFLAIGVVADLSRVLILGTGGVEEESFIELWGEKVSLRLVGKELL